MLLNMLVVITILWVCFLKEILIFQKYWNIHRWNDIFDFFQNNSKLGDRCGYRWNKTAHVLNIIKTAVMIKGFTIIFSLLLYMFENIHNIFSKGIYQNFEKKKKRRWKSPSEWENTQNMSENWLLGTQRSKGRHQELWRGWNFLLAG